MTCKERGQVAGLTRAMHYVNNPELSSTEETRCQLNRSKADIKLATGRVHPLADLGLACTRSHLII
jgi:hypothetical protein